MDTNHPLVINIISLLIVTESTRMVDNVSENNRFEREARQDRDRNLSYSYELLVGSFNYLSKPNGNISKRR